MKLIVCALAFAMCGQLAHAQDGVTVTLHSLTVIGSGYDPGGISPGGTRVVGARTVGGVKEGIHWVNGTLVRLEELAAGKDTAAKDVTENGLIVGWAVNAQNFKRAAIWPSPTADPPNNYLPSAFGSGEFVAVNNGSVAVGNGDDTDLGYVNALVWQSPDSIARLPNFVSPPFSTRTRAEALDVNNSGVVVGFMTFGSNGSLPVRWDPDGLGGYTASLLTGWNTAGGWRGVATAVNDNGVITGQRKSSGGTLKVSHSCVLSCPFSTRGRALGCD